MTDRIRAITETLGKALNARDDNGMPTPDLGMAIHEMLPNRTLEDFVRLSSTYLVWAEGHYMRLDQHGRDLWLATGIERVRKLSADDPDIQEICDLGSTILARVLSDRPTEIITSVHNSVRIAAVTDGEPETHVAVAIALRVLMQVVHQKDQRLAMAEGINIMDDAYRRYRDNN